MNKFLKGALACAMVVPCMTGLVGCGDKKVDKTEVAYKEVFGEVQTITNKFSSLETVGTEFQLNINMSINAQQIVDNLPSSDGAISAQLKAVLGGRHSQTNKELFGDIGIVDNNNETSILSAYMIDSIGEDEYVEIGPISESKWNILKDVLYTESEGVYVSANTAFDATATYYMATEDLVHIYMNSNISVLDEAIGMPVSEMVPMLSDGQIYGTLYVGEDLDDIIGDDIDDDDPLDDDIDMDLDDVFSDIIPDMDDYDDFKEELAEAGMALTNIESNGDIGIRISGEGMAIELIAKANGGLRVVMDILMPMDQTTIMDMDIVIDIDLVDEVEDKYIPTDLDSYGEAMDLEAWLEELMAGMESM